MSRTKPSEIDTVALEWVVCGWCHQPAGAWCVARSGAWAQYLHGARTWPIQRGWQIGFLQGEKTVLDNIISSTEPPAYGNRNWSREWLDRMLAERREEIASGQL